MKITKALLATFVVSLLVATFAIGARADELNRRSVIKFSQPVEIPGQVLPAGTYTMELFDTFSYRHIVRFYNADRTQLFATVLAIPNYRLEPTGDTVMTFMERPADAPSALKAWFYPNDKFGQEFVYPDRPVQLCASGSAGAGIQVWVDEGFCGVQGVAGMAGAAVSLDGG